MPSQAGQIAVVVGVDATEYFPEHFRGLTKVISDSFCFLAESPDALGNGFASR